MGTNPSDCPLVVILSEMEIHEVRVGDLARRAGVAFPTVYYNLHSLTDIIAEATIVMLNRFLAPFSQLLSDVQGRSSTRTGKSSAAQ